jgi:hypothetical protein
MKVIPLPTELRVAVGFSHKVIINAADVALMVGTTSGGFQIFPDVLPKSPITQPDYSLPRGTCIARVGFQLIVPFSGGLVSALVMALGDGGNGTRYLTYALTDLLTASGNTLDCGVADSPYVFTQADTAAGTTNALFASFVSTGGNFDALTAGQVEVYFDLQLLNRLTVIGEP